MTINESKEWVKSFLLKDEYYKIYSSNIDYCNGYSSLLHEMDKMFYFSENDANAILEFMKNKGMKPNRY